ncbi:MAG: hypothetical protein C5B59_04495 [Bacteroidetes bacterium]|nr:MAG: hypothetical protein C5B59_04495 [Bacteroidota bacterium]
MIINRNNYEEFFLLYVDNELSATERKSVESFVRENPDLAEEFMILNQSKLIPEDELKFEKKQFLLKKTTVESLINTSNCEEYFLSYADGELNEEDRMAVELFASQNPLYQKELNLLLKARLIPEEQVIFEHKDKLYRKERDKKSLIYRMSGIAAAASILFLIGLFIFLSKPNTVNNPGSSPVTQKNDPKKINGNPVVTPVTIDTLNKTSPTARQDESKRLERVAGRQEEKSRRKTRAEQAPDNKELQLKDRQDEMNLAGANIERTILKKENNLTVVPSSPSIAVSPIVPVAMQPSLHPVKSDSSQLHMAMMEKTNAEDVSIMSFSPKKNRMRGVYRRVTRVFGKTTNADDEKRSVLIGSFQIALK